MVVVTVAFIVSSGSCDSALGGGSSCEHEQRQNDKRVA